MSGSAALGVVATCVVGAVVVCQDMGVEVPKPALYAALVGMVTWILSGLFLGEGKGASGAMPAGCVPVELTHDDGGPQACHGVGSDDNEVATARVLNIVLRCTRLRFRIGHYSLLVFSPINFDGRPMTERRKNLSPGICLAAVA